MLEKQRLFETCFIWVKRKENGIKKRSVIMQKIKWFILNIVTYQLLNKFREGLRENMEKQKAIIYHHPSPITTRLTYVGV
jgi:hypothetical protein